jgi:glycosyltransferase involved in cell wall biosynthesis
LSTAISTSVSTRARTRHPVVTVCVPTYNGDAYLDRCLEAITGQTYPNLDILVVDNQSTDASAERLARWRSRDERLRVVVNDRNIGLVPNRNRCIELAKGEWIKFMDVDDLLAPTAIERLLEAAGSSHRMAICRRLFHYVDVDETQRELMEREVRRYEVRELLPGRRYITPEEVAWLALEYRGRNFVGEPTAVMMHRSVFDEFGSFNEDLVQIPDLEYWLRVGLHTGIAYVDEPLSFFRVHNGAASAANQELRSFRADRVDQLILLHEYLFHPHFEPVRGLARKEGVLDELRADFKRKAARIALRAALDGRSADPLVREHWGQWRIISRSHPRLRPPGDALLPLAAFVLRATRMRR